MRIIKIDNEVHLKPIENKTSVELLPVQQKGKQSMREAAFLVGYLDTATGQLLGCVIFSEEHPTMIGRGKFQVTICRGYGKDFEEGVNDLKNALNSPSLAWTKKFMNER